MFTPTKPWLWVRRCSRIRSAKSSGVVQKPEAVVSLHELAPVVHESRVHEHVAQHVGAHFVAHQAPLPRAEPQPRDAGLDLLDGEAHQRA